MRKIIQILLLLLLMIFFESSVHAQAKKDTIKVLFVGNSYTYVQNLPQLVSIMSDSTNTKLITRKSTVGGAFLSEHWFSKRGLKTKEIISKGHFDAVILQENSMGTINQPDSTIKYAKLLCGLIRKSGAKPYLYLTWAREKVPQYQDEITKAYVEIAKENGAVLVPVGEAWELAKQLRPTIELYNADGSHPSNLGAILSAYVFVGVLTSEVPARIPEWYQIKDIDGETVELTNIDSLDAVFFRKVAEKTLSKYGLK
jgi:hypothetical protein